MPCTRRTRRIGFTIAATAALLSATSLVAPTRASADSVPVLAGVNVVTTDTSGWTTVRVPKAVRLDFGFGGPSMGNGPAGTSVRGAGRIFGMVLERGGTPVVEAVQLSDCAAAGCRGQFGFGFIEVRSHHGTIDPGVYHLYVITDGAPVTATLSFDGLSGTSQLGITPSSDIVEQTLTPLLPSTGVVDPPLYSAGGSATMGGNGGLLIDDLIISAASFEGGYFGSCAGQGAPPPIYLAGCAFPPDSGTISNLSSPFLICNPVGFCDPGFTVDAAIMPGTLFGIGQTPVPTGQAGTWSQGDYFEGAAVLTSEAANAVWLPYVASSAGSSTQATPVSSPPTPAPTAAPSPAPTAAPQPVTLPNTAAPASSGAPAAAALALIAATAGTVRRRRRRKRSH